MRVNIAQSSPPSPSSHTLSPHSSQTILPSSLRLNRTSSTLPLSSKSTAHNSLKRSCSASLNGHDFPHHQKDHFTPKQQTASFNRHVDVLEPSLLGICPNPPDWPARDAVLRECFARRANSIEIPLSLRMIKMKQKFLRLEKEIDIDIEGLSNVVENNPMNNLCCSSLFIIRKIQSYALKNKGMMLDDGIVSKVQREMTSSFVWLFKEVFAKTPDLMLQVMVLTSNFATFSLESFNLLVEVENLVEEGSDVGVNLEKWGVGYLELGNLGVPLRGNLEDSEVKLWNSVVDEADEIRGDMNQGLEFVVDGDSKDYGFDQANEISRLVEENKKFEIEKDDYEEYHRTDMLYQIGLFQDPNNTLLLSNYAQFLCLVSRDYDRAEGCFKRAIQLDPNDAEIVSQYANFLWVVRKDLWGAEERFQEAVAAEPDNSYHASKYASFLWSTGGDETCYPIDPPLGKI